MCLFLFHFFFQIEGKAKERKTGIESKDIGTRKYKSEKIYLLFIESELSPGALFKIGDRMHFVFAANLVWFCAVGLISFRTGDIRSNYV